ncbi:MAG TPA: hypothetical protein VLU92_09540 [Candidatus Dormibacteraeota bacterium]|nr:hypothetical protein [Candidatus Dormibacteraeota bacterium]
MSLRSEIRAAIDDMAPSMGGLPERVVDTVLAENPARRRRNRMLFRMRAPLSLVAAIVAIALVAAVLVGGRLIQDWNAAHTQAPAGVGMAQPDLQTAAAEIETNRVVQFAQLAPGAICPVGPVDSSGHYGQGPFHGVPNGSAKDTAWGTYWNLGAETDGISDPFLLVRAVDLRTQQRFVFVGQYAFGPVGGKDNLSGSLVDQHSELLFDMSHQPKTKLDGLTYWQLTVGMPKGNSGCYGWQIDGPGGSEEKFVYSLG